LTGKCPSATKSGEGFAKRRPLGMETRPYIIGGPTVIGNTSGSFGVVLPKGKFAVVRDVNYSNGGRGPCTVDGVRYASRERAEEVVKELIH
jgi:hypothetical protein